MRWRRFNCTLVCAAFVLAAATSARSQTFTTPHAPISANVAGAIIDSFKLLIGEHAMRIAVQEKTRRELGGPFWSDYQASLRMPRTWGDSDGWLVNYVGHPIHGAAAGFIWMHHDPRSRTESFGLNARYWSTRWRAMAWSAAYSVQFEVGPLSEASVGNVGLRPETVGWVDYVVTPVGGLALMIGEDALDRYFIRWVEGRTNNRAARAAVRVLFNPGRSMGNLAVTQAPWARDDRPLSGR